MIRKLTLATALTAAIAFPAMAQDVKAPAMGTPATATNAAPARKRRTVTYLAGGSSVDR